MIKVKSIHPKSFLNTFRHHIGTTASVGPEYLIVSEPCVLKGVQLCNGIKISSNRSFSIQNLTNSENYLNSEAITTISACVGQPYEFNVSSSDAAGSSTSGTKGAPFITAGTLLVINWSCTKGDMGASIMFDRVTKKDRAQ